MCGIAGIISKNRLSEGTEAVLKNMARTLAHRGPDDEGYYSDAHVAFAHKRLSIIDLAAGHQPMANEDDTVLIVFNGMIYNYLELRKELVARGHTFRTHSDTEVIIHAYEQYGESCVDRFNGMFAFAIWDKRKNAVFGFRDRLGVKPFYYACDGKRFIFASEIKALLVEGGIRAEPNLDGLNDYFVFQYCIGEKTLFRGINKLLPGHILSLHVPTFRLAVRRYWDIEYNIDTRSSEKQHVSRLRGLIDDAVRIRLRSDVPLGTHLSGGIDSTTVISFAARHLAGKTVNAFFGGFREGASFNELEYAQHVAKKSRARLHKIVLGPKEFVDSIDKLIYCMDEPAAGPGVFPQYYVSRCAARNVKVVLGGQGGDENFIGYARYLIAYLEECLLGAIRETAEKKRYVATLRSIIPNLSYLRSYVPLLKYFWGEGLFDPPEKRYFRLIDRSEGVEGFFHDDFPFDREACFQEYSGIFNEKHLASLINKISYFDMKYNLAALLHVEDRTSMAVSLESRVPLLDYRLVELIASVPPVMKFKNGELKYLFKRAVKGIVPGRIIDRKDKMGFPVPLVQWYRNGKIKKFVNDILLDGKTRRRGIFDVPQLEKAFLKEHEFGRLIWGALCVELWFRTFIDKRPHS